MQLYDKITVNQIEELLRHYRIYACRVELFRGITYLKNHNTLVELNYISMIDRAIETIRKSHKYGEKFYWVLYFTYLSPKELFEVNEIIEKINSGSDSLKISRSTYFRIKNRAIKELCVIVSPFDEAN